MVVDAALAVGFAVVAVLGVTEAERLQEKTGAERPASKTVTAALAGRGGGQPLKRGKRMFQWPMHRLVVALTASTLALTAVASGQGSSPPAESLAAEIRALKGDINERLEASIRAQLLVARVQLQEQRVNNVVRQLEGVQEQLRANGQARGPLEAGLTTFGGIQTNLPAERQSDMDAVVGPLRTNLEQLARSDDELRRQQAQLTAVLSEEQARWTLFNARLEELERTFWKVSR